MNYADIKIFCRITIQYLREYSEISTIHGVRYLVEKRSRAEKIIWAIILILSLSGCIYMINGIWIKYQSNPIVVSFATESTPIYEIPFPAVTICPELKYAKSEFNFSDIHDKIKNQEATTQEVLEKYHILGLLCQLQESDRAIVARDETFNESFFQTIYNLKPSFAPVVSFMGKNMENCFSPVITDEGICYSFNILDRSQIFKEQVIHYGDFHLVKNIKEDNSTAYDIENGFKKNSDIFTYPYRALASGSTNDLNIQLYMEYNDLDYLCNPNFQGFRVVLHNPYDIPSPSKHYISVPPDKTVMVAIDPGLVKTSDEVKKYKSGIRKCFLKNERPLMYFKIYTESNCRLECRTNYTLNSCGCVEYFMPRENQTKICGTGSSNCFSEVEHKMLMEELQTKLSGKMNTKCDCLPLCTDLSFSVETSQTNYNWDMEYFFKKFNKTTWEATSLLKIYFKREQFMTLERNEMYGIVDLVSNFGGLLGLFVGFSLLSLVEIVYFLTIRIYCNGRNLNNSKDHTISAWP